MITITYKDFRAEIEQKGAELISFYKGERNILWCRDPEIWGSSAPILFPICGRIREGKYTHNGTEYFMNAHGFASGRMFSVLERSAEGVTLGIESDAETVKQYPFTFSFKIRFALGDEGLDVSLITENKGTDTMYYSVGGHWGIALDALATEYTLRFDEKTSLYRDILDGAFLSGETERLTENSTDLPLGYELCENDSYVFQNVPRAVTLVKGKKEVLRMEYPDSPHLVLWTLPGQKYICIEPWNGMPDGKESGALSEKIAIETLLPGESQTVLHRILVK